MVWGRSRDDGAVAVEAALITPFIFILIFGAIDFGMLAKDWLTTSFAVRGAARTASSLPQNAQYANEAVLRVQSELGGTDPGQGAKLWVYKAVADGTPEGGSGSFNACSKCAKFTWDATQRKYVANGSSTWLASTQRSCAGDATSDYLGVYAEVKHKSVTGMFPDWTITDKSVMKLEPTKDSSLC